MNVLAPYFKAVVAFVAPAATLITAAVQEGSPGGEFITQGEGITAACACIITAAAVYAVPNKQAQPDGKHEA
ncbi:hypothetical protein [Pseudarthrobacter sp. NamE5]|uniref:hypothetical protein n=1 Tax=Pseudarthrobacter sp. NamE5 TaxID=2576839 RepID=UPI00110B7E70|nr:hypothetical protein [Pseudarthrobacter sp. NamE5]TLM87201.1 hypothetical protein FDW84_05235 [Pseudarthrobacter sp. NamE5]